MELKKIDDSDRIWTVTLGEDGRLHAELDPKLMERLAEARSAKEVVDVLSEEVARTRAW